MPYTAIGLEQEPPCSRRELLQTIDLILKDRPTRILCCGAGPHIIAISRAAKRIGAELVCWESNSDRLSAANATLKFYKVDIPIESRMLNVYETEVNVYGWLDLEPSAGTFDLLIDSTNLGAPGRWGVGPIGRKLLNTRGKIVVFGMLDNKQAQQYYEFWESVGHLTVDPASPNTPCILTPEAAPAQLGHIDRIKDKIKRMRLLNRTR